MDSVCVLALAVSGFGMGWFGIGWDGSWRSGKSTRQPAAPVSASAQLSGWICFVVGSFSFVRLLGDLSASALCLECVRQPRPCVYRADAARVLLLRCYSLWDFAAESGVEVSA